MTMLQSAPSVYQSRHVPRLLPTTGDTSLAGHLGRYGRMPRTDARLINEVSAAGLRGRGGASFPTGTKMAAVAAGRERPVVVANGTEGEPLSGKDGVLLHHNPHLVIDGILAAALALQAQRAILCIKRGQPELVRTLRRALAERRSPVDIELAEAPARYLAGQESALMSWLNGGDARPKFGPRPAERGVGGAPTLVDNVETLAHVALIARFGAEWFRAVGTPEEPGTALVTVTGVQRPGVYEVPFGLPLPQLLAQTGLGVPAPLLIGGYFGRWVTPRLTTAHAWAPGGGEPRLSNAGLAGLGARFGCGVIAALPPDTCPLEEVAAVTDWFAANSAGQCGACLHGLADIAGAMHAVVTGHAGALERMQRWTAMVRGRGACQLPDGAAAFVDSAAEVFAAEMAAHRHGGCHRPYRRALPVPAPGGWR
jgi:NADH:ubiquinone oxidoreductase subunit F (NADH-binding)